VNSHIGVRYYRAVLARAAELCPDLLIYTGDFVTHVEHAALLSDVLTAAHGRLATLAVLGNHDYWAGAAHVAEAVRSAGIILLGNGYVRIPTSRRLRSPNLVRASTVTEGEHLLVCGYEGPWSSAPWQPPQIAPGELALMMTHTPDNIYRLSRLGFTVVFAGHYHAGQMRIPWLGSLVVPSLYGRRFDHGHFVVNGTHLFVTAGVGTAIPPRRIYCQPDIFVVDIRRGQAVSAEPVAAAYAASDAQAPAAKGPGRSVPPSPPGGPHA
jgi:predicted MPP superfamily phosphohydrolase